MQAPRPPGSTSASCARGRKTCWPRRSRQAWASSPERCRPRPNRAGPCAAPAASPPIAQSAERRSGQQSPGTVAAVRVTELWRRMGWPAARPSGVAASPAASVAAQVVLTPACGLAGRPAGLRPGRAGQLPGSGPDAARTDRGGVPVSPVRGPSARRLRRHRASRSGRGDTRLGRGRGRAAPACRAERGGHRGEPPLLRARLAHPLRRRVRRGHARAARAGGALPRAAHPGLADPAGRRRGLHRVHPGGPPGAAAQPGQRVLGRGARRVGGPGAAARRGRPVPVRGEDRRAGGRPGLPERRAGPRGDPGRRGHR